MMQTKSRFLQKLMNPKTPKVTDFTSFDFLETPETTNPKDEINWNSYSQEELEEIFNETIDLIKKASDSFSPIKPNKVEAIYQNLHDKEVQEAKDTK